MVGAVGALVGNSNYTRNNTVKDHIFVVGAWEALVDRLVGSLVGTLVGAWEALVGSTNRDSSFRSPFRSPDSTVDVLFVHHSQPRMLR